MDRPSPEIVDCPQCGAKNFAIDDLCASCHQALTLVILPRPKIRRFGIGTVMTLIAVVAVCLAPVRISPWLSVIATLILVPAFVRTFLVLEGRRLDGRKVPKEAYLGIFMKSFFMVLIIILSSGFAFLTTCSVFPASRPYPAIMQIIAGSIAGLPVFYFSFSRLWPEREWL
jgi:hypothetical protein